MVLLDPVCLELRTIAVSMVAERSKAIAGAPGAEAQRRTARERLCCFARNDGAAGRGRKS
ncbi:MAG: hypothetical protein E5V92_03485 [Mesorhizobium sp.]|nr:MAG: hypothetical protein EOS61_13705 [Mesorhizobium sp.]TIV96795.1 MAG: hypothetical protein E5V85_16770 [Mesorhizobium sp.]TJW89459.1 MAG: hypothetical protein E5V92_03485 [Mesorhizobium sp.]